MQTRIWKWIWETCNKKLAVLDKSHLLGSLPKQTKKTALTILLAMTSESLDWRLCLLAKQGEAAILQRERGMLECHQMTPSREKRNKGEQGMHGGIIRQCVHRSLQPKVAAAALVELPACLKLWRKEYSCVLCLLWSRRTFLPFTPCSLLSVITQWTTGVNISI